MSKFSFYMSVFFVDLYDEYVAAVNCATPNKLHIDNIYVTLS